MILLALGACTLCIWAAIFLKTQTSCALAAPEKRLVTQNEHKIIAAATLFKIIFGALKFDCYFRRCVRSQTPASLARDIMQITKMVLRWRRMLLPLRGSPNL